LIEQSSWTESSFIDELLDFAGLEVFVDRMVLGFGALPSGLVLALVCGIDLFIKNFLMISCGKSNSIINFSLLLILFQKLGEYQETIIKSRLRDKT